MDFISKIGSALIEGPTNALGQGDFNNAKLYGSNQPKLDSQIRLGVVRQFNVGMYSALVSDGQYLYVCFVGSFNVTPGLGYSDAAVLREGDEVFFVIADRKSAQGMILARRPTLFNRDTTHSPKVQHPTDLERRTHFFSNETYRHEVQPYILPLTTKTDTSSKVFTSVRPTDLVPGDCATMNQHHCGFFGGPFSFTVSGGRAQIRFFALENRIRVVADSIIQYLFAGNMMSGHNRRYISEERSSCLYQEERFGLKSKEQPVVKVLGEDAETYHKKFYFTENKKKKQTLRQRFLEHLGWYGGLIARYCLRPDPDDPDVRTLETEAKDAGVSRETIDPSGQYRFAATGMIGTERIGRIPVPVRHKHIWEKDVKEPEAKKLEEFKHDESHPFYRQLEHADRVAYDLKNSYARYEEKDSGFTVPEEKDLKNKLKDIYDPGFTESKTVKLEKYDKRRSGVWQGEDGSIIIRDAWGSEVVMIGGNIQFSCAGNIETLPGKTALTLAGDDIIHKAQNSVDIHAAEHDVHIDGKRNVQVMAGTDTQPGGVTIEARGTAYPWETQEGESTQSRGIVLKSAEKGGKIVTDAENLVLKSKEYTALVSTKGDVYVSSLKKSIYAQGKDVILANDQAAVGFFGGTAFSVGETAITAGTSSALLVSGGKYPVPIMWVDVEDPAEPIISGCSSIVELLKDDEKVSRGYSDDKLEKMYFHFRSSQECGTTKAWEIDGGDKFTLFEPFWVQVSMKFETLKGKVQQKTFEDCQFWEGSERGVPWPGDKASSAKYAQISGQSPKNMDDEGFNKARKEVSDNTPVEEENLVGGYIIQQSY